MTQPVYNPTSGQLGSFRSDGTAAHLALPILEDNSLSKPSLATFASQTLGWVAIQLTVTCAISGVMYARKETVIDYLPDHMWAFWLPIIMLFFSLGCMYMTASHHRDRRLGWFCVFTLSMSFVVGVSVIQYSPEVVLLSAGTTWIIVCGAAAYSNGLAKRGKDLDSCGPALGGILTTVLIIGFANVFLKLPWVSVGLSAVSVVLFTCYLAYDLCRLYLAKDADDPMMADGLLPAVEIYLDIVNIFVNLLSLIGGSSGD